ncbi:hypothetical protein BDV98DRAFT_607806 [Pterulicium gracile]|uniref:Uncharacterized protein n=1 Tax=Pterulicium gracile TaxID=1884261 RepID=A0A5C3Q5T1_9AGAR|nr:hypothetical protein BDV98DRAFT_607806 [Pterula gracilis]
MRFRTTPTSSVAASLYAGVWPVFPSLRNHSQRYVLRSQYSHGAAKDCRACAVRLRTKVLAYLSTNYIIDGAAEHVPQSITQWGKRRHAFGEMIHAAELVKSYGNEHSTCPRDATWIEYEHDVDVNAHLRSRREEFSTQNSYGQYPSAGDVPLVADSPESNSQTMVLAVVYPAILHSVDPNLCLAWSKGMKTSVITIDINSITHVVGRVVDRGRTAYIKRAGAVEECRILEEEEAPWTIFDNWMEMPDSDDYSDDTGDSMSKKLKVHLLPLDSAGQRAAMIEVTGMFALAKELAERDASISDPSNDRRLTEKLLAALQHAYGKVPLGTRHQSFIGVTPLIQGPCPSLNCIELDASYKATVCALVTSLKESVEIVTDFRSKCILQFSGSADFCSRRDVKCMALLSESINATYPTRPEDARDKDVDVFRPLYPVSLLGAWESTAAHCFGLRARF